MFLRVGNNTLFLLVGYFLSLGCLVIADGLAYQAASSVVAKVLVSAFSRDEETTKDLTAAEETVRGLTFDEFNEMVDCKVMTGIKLDDFNTVVNSITNRLGIPDKIRRSILENKYADVTHQVVIDFKFKIGETGAFTYGRIATYKPDDRTINLAYSVYQLGFKLSPRVIEHKKKKKFLGFTTGTKVWREIKERNLSEKEADYMQAYFMRKAIQGFKREYSRLLAEKDEL